ncbi:hypothetical protein Syun_002125 [Stephania yunnanensis]|uniref:Uncharacterized protein n=1 Tax=Stephania yunnanensis TaxID=152371 RepID=A0AAP0LFY7_9MAGN
MAVREGGDDDQRRHADGPASAVVRLCSSSWTRGAAQREGGGRLQQQLRQRAAALDSARQWRRAGLAVGIDTEERDTAETRRERAATAAKDQSAGGAAATHDATVVVARGRQPRVVGTIDLWDLGYHSRLSGTYLEASAGRLGEIFAII